VTGKADRCLRILPRELIQEVIRFQRTRVTVISLTPKPRLWHSRWRFSWNSQMLNRIMCTWTITAERTAI